MKYIYLILLIFAFSANVSAQLSADIQHSFVRGSDNGSIDLDVLGGYPPYEYTWTKEGDIISLNEDLSFLSGGNYCVEVLDSRCGSLEQCFEVEECGGDEGISIISEVIPSTSREGCDNGKIDIKFYGRASSYKVTWSRISLFGFKEILKEVTVVKSAGSSLIDDPIIDLENISVGFWDFNNKLKVEIQGPNCEKLTKEFKIFCDCDDLSVEPGIIKPFRGKNNGKIWLNIEGFPGENPLVLWEINGQYKNVSSLENLGPGEYCYSVNSLNGCALKGCVTLERECFTYSQDIFNVEHVSGPRKGNGSGCDEVVENFQFNISGGVPPYTLKHTFPLIHADDYHNATLEDFQYWTVSNKDQILFTNAPNQFYLEIADAVCGTSLVLVDNFCDCSGYSLCNPVVNDIIDINQLGSINLRINPTAINPKIQWDWGQETTSRLDDLPALTYWVTVTDDYCEYVNSFEINDCVTDKNIIVSQKDNWCGFVEGEITVELEEIADIVFYNAANRDDKTVVNQVRSMTFDNLESGEYIVDVNFNNSCVKSKAFRIYERSMQISYESENSWCNGNLLGSISLATNPTSLLNDPLTNIIWSNGATTPSINVQPGIYSATVTYGNCIRGTGKINIQQATLVTNISDPNCLADNGSISAYVRNGNGEGTFLWSTGETTSKIENLSSGPYSVTVTKDNCHYSKDLVLENSIYGNLIKRIDYTCVGNEYDLEVILNEDLPAEPQLINFQWSNGIQSRFLNSAKPGLKYEVKATTGPGCEDSFVFNLNPFDLIYSQTNAILCNGSIIDGSIEIQLPSIISNNPSQFSDFVINPMPDKVSKLKLTYNRPPGTYDFTIEAGGCSYNLDVLIKTETLKIDLLELENVSDACENDGTIILAANGNATFEWSDGFVGPERHGLSEGDYTVTATLIDCGETISRTFEICSCSDCFWYDQGDDRVETYDGTCPNSSFEIDEEITSASDVGIFDGSININIIGESSQFYFNWFRVVGGIENLISNEQDLTNIAAGVYKLNASNGCNEKLEYFFIPFDTNCDLNLEISQNSPCDGANAILEINEFHKLLYYKASNGHTGTINYGQDIIVPFGSSSSLTIDVIDPETGCNEVFTIISNSIDGERLSIKVPEEDIVNCEEVRVQVLNGTPPYKFTWTNENGTVLSRNEKLFFNRTGGYSVKVTDDCGKVAYLDKYLKCDCDVIWPILYQTRKCLDPCDKPIFEGGCSKIIVRPVIGMERMKVKVIGFEDDKDFEFLYSGGEDLVYKPEEIGNYEVILVSKDNCIRKHIYRFSDPKDQGYCALDYLDEVQGLTYGSWRVNDSNCGAVFNPSAPSLSRGYKEYGFEHIVTNFDFPCKDLRIVGAACEVPFEEIEGESTFNSSYPDVECTNVTLCYFQTKNVDGNGHQRTIPVEICHDEACPTVDIVDVEVSSDYKNRLIKCRFNYFYDLVAVPELVVYKFNGEFNESSNFTIEETIEFNVSFRTDQTEIVSVNESQSGLAGVFRLRNKSGVICESPRFKIKDVDFARIVNDCDDNPISLIYNDNLDDFVIFTSDKDTIQGIDATHIVGPTYDTTYTIREVLEIDKVDHVRCLLDGTYVTFTQFYNNCIIDKYSRVGAFTSRQIITNVELVRVEKTGVWPIGFYTYSQQGDWFKAYDLWEQDYSEIWSKYYPMEDYTRFFYHTQSKYSVISPDLKTIITYVNGEPFKEISIDTNIIFREIITHHDGYIVCGEISDGFKQDTFTYSEYYPSLVFYKLDSEFNVVSHEVVDMNVGVNYHEVVTNGVDKIATSFYIYDTTYINDFSYTIDTCYAVKVFEFKEGNQNRVTVSTDADFAKSEDQITVYPNPSTSSFYVDLNFKNISDAKIEVFDLNGKLVYSSVIKSGNPLTNSELIGSAHWNSGMYTLRYSSENRVITKKLIKTN